MALSRRLGVGIIGAGEVAQVIHLPVLSLLSHLYSVEIICDLSAKNVEHCAFKFNIPHKTTNPEDVFASSAVNVVFVLTSHEFHETYCIKALQAGKHVMVEKPMTLSMASAQRIIDAEKAAAGPRVFVGYMRRYAAGFTKAFMREVQSIPKILYARSRDFSGPNAFFVSQSGTFQVKNTDLPENAPAQKHQLLDSLLNEAFDGREVTEAKKQYCLFLGGLGSHDISLMREVIGVPESVAGVSVNHPFYSAILNYRNKNGEPFAVTYESGIDAVPDFDAEFAIYGEFKRVSIHYPSPYVKGLPIKVKVLEVNEHGEAQGKEILASYEDSYTAELKELHACICRGREIKTSAEDALRDLNIFDMLYMKYDGLS